MGGRNGWGIRAYVIWFGISSFFVPFLILVFCYVKIYYVIWENLNMRAATPIKEVDLKKASRFKDNIQRAFSTTKLNCLNRKKNINLRIRGTKDRTENKFDAADKFRVHNIGSLKTIQCQNPSGYIGKFKYLIIY